MKMNLGLSILSAFIAFFFYNVINAQNPRLKLKKLLVSPLEYTVLKAEGIIKIDGRDNEEDWNNAPWTSLFTDIESGDRNGTIGETRVKMLWNDNFLYLYAYMEESHVWASLKEHDESIFQDNAFEMFIDPDGDTHNYVEFQINAYGAVWDLFMPKPYRNGGRALSNWDIKGLKKAIHVNGTINNSTDKDKSWNIELAIPLESITRSKRQHPSNDPMWRMQFSRVEWTTELIDGKYQRKRRSEAGRRIAEQYTVWSPVGIVNLHYPERWGYVFFSDGVSSSNFLSDELENSMLLLWKYYYLQQYFKRKTGKYADKVQQLQELFPDMVDMKEEAPKIQISGTEHQFWIESSVLFSDAILTINNQGEVQLGKCPKLNK